MKAAKRRKAEMKRRGYFHESKREEKISEGREGEEKIRSREEQERRRTEGTLCCSCCSYLFFSSKGPNGLQVALDNGLRRADHLLDEGLDRLAQIGVHVPVVVVVVKKTLCSKEDSKVSFLPLLLLLPFIFSSLFSSLQHTLIR